MEAMISVPAEPSVELSYKGRKTSRVNSEQRRRTILEAALSIVVKEGVRGVRHRAVAKAANVPLSATTYYFKDISDLISDAFILFIEKGDKAFKTFWDESEQQLTTALAGLDGSVSARSQFTRHVTDLAVAYVQTQIKVHRDFLIAERSFHLECLRNDALKPVASRHQRYLLASLERFFEQLGVPEPALDTKIFTAVIMQAEYDALTQGEERSIEFIRRMIHRYIELVVG